MRDGVRRSLVAGLLVACGDGPPTGGARALVVNEIVSHNVAGRVDPDSGDCPEHDDWIELLNPSASVIALDRFSLEDAGGTRSPLPARTLAPGERIVLTADDDPEAGALHLPFGLSRDGDVVVLREGDRVLDRVEVPPLDPDLAWGRYGDAEDRWRVMSPSPGAPNEAPPDDPCLVPRGGFDDHTVPCLATVEGFEAMASGRAGDLTVVKFDVLGFADGGDLEPVFLDNRFFQLHDEWYLFRMLNGQPVRGETEYPPYPGSFATIDAIYAWASAVPPETLFPDEFLRWTTTGRLTSQRYYALALSDPRAIAAGTLIHVAGDGSSPERWAWELEHSDVPTHAEIDAIFDALLPALSPEIGRDLRWLVRSPAQEELARSMEDGRLSWHDRLLRYDELSDPGTVEVYRPGLVAGRVRIVRAGQEGVEDASPSDVLVLEEIPDYLPPCAALITTVPQTPLAHVALLAESRGIPNLHVAGLSEDPQWDAWSRTNTPVVVRATSPAGFEVRELTTAEWTTWLSLQDPPVPELGSIDPEAVPFAVDLSTVPIEAMPDQRLPLGGKSSGFVALLDTPGVVTPDTPLALSIRGYTRHVDPLRPTMAQVLAAPEFGHPGVEALRYLVLEGRAAYDDRYPEPFDATAADLFLQDHPAGTTLGDLAIGSGLRGLVEETPIPPEVTAELLPVLRSTFAPLAPGQGLRFRSSSNVEDAEGFVGAGLYTSSTGWLDPAQGAPVEDAIRATWASYWGAEAFEERHAVGLDHLAGAMGITVHPHFQDEAELANGVVHATRLPDGSATVTVDSQIGAISVTNPPVDACRSVLPEVDVVRVDAEGARAIDRLQRSTETAADVLSDEQLHALADMVLPVLDAWLGVENGRLSPTQARSTLTLDLEFRDVADGWPAYADGHTLGERLVLKQCRSLEPSAAGLPDEVQALPFPRDLLARASVVTRQTCEADGLALVVDELLTDPLATPDLGHAQTPFVGALDVDGLPLTWLDLAAVERPAGATFELRATLTPEAAAATGIATIELSDGRLTVTGDAPVSAPLDGCAASTLWASPESWLQTLLTP